jgi:hypothetical protein
MKKYMSKSDTLNNTQKIVSASVASVLKNKSVIT